MAREMGVFIRWGEIQVGIQADGVAWNPDVATDMVNRVESLWDSTLAKAKEYGYFEIVDPDEDDDEETLYEIGDDVAASINEVLRMFGEDTDG